jgi:uncharacterized protein
MRFRKDALQRANRDTGPQGGQVRLELQADCYAGLWVGHAIDTGFVEDITRQDVADALDAAAAVGDDRIQEKAQGRVTRKRGRTARQSSGRVGSSAAQAGGPQTCDTFSVARV